MSRLLPARALALGALLSLAPASASADGAPTSADGEPKPELWAGHQIVLGAREIPVLGKLSTRTDNFVLAEVRRVGDEVVLVQRACDVRFREVAGVAVSMPPAALEKLPAVEFRLPAGITPRLSEPWIAGWDAKDADGDGKPGATVTVSAALCGGELYTASHSKNRARSWSQKGAVAGELRVEVEQKVLGTSGGCLGAVASDTKERLEGTFAYVPVPGGSTCASLRASWPVAAKEADPASR